MVQAASKFQDHWQVVSEVGSFVWSPDGSHLAYRVDEGASDVIELNTVLANGTELNKIYSAKSLFSEEGLFSWY